MTEAKQLADDLSEADRRKDEFLATLAHELRNPLAPISNAVQVLRRGAPAPPPASGDGALDRRHRGRLLRRLGPQRHRDHRLAPRTGARTSSGWCRLPWGSTRTPLASGSAIRVAAAGVLSMYDVAVLAPHASAGRVDWSAALGDTNRAYAGTLWYDNRNNVVRTEDKAHLTLEGATRAATWTAAAMVELFATLPPPPDGPTALQLPPRADRGRRPGHPRRAGGLTVPVGQRRRNRRTPNPARTAPPTVSFTATIQSVTLRPMWLSSVTIEVGSERS